jgi:hypothetical protein
MKRKEYFNIEQGSKEWLELRMGVFTSSEIESLFKEPKSKAAKAAGQLSDTTITYVTEKACELIYKTPKPFAYAKATEWGNMYEDYAAEAYQQTTGNELKVIGFVTLGDDTGTSPDRYCNDNALLEIKCPYVRTNHIKNLLNLKSQEDLLKRNKQYYYQVQHQLYVTGREYCDFASFDPRILESKNQSIWNNCIHVLRIEKDTSIDFEGKIKAAAEYRDYILKQTL